MKMIDYITPDQRISAPPPTLDQKRAKAVAYLRARGKYILDPGTRWRPTATLQTDVRETMARAQQKDMLVMLEAERLPVLMRRQA
jgi:hypothetical protein